MDGGVVARAHVAALAQVAQLTHRHCILAPPALGSASAPTRPAAEGQQRKVAVPDGDLARAGGVHPVHAHVERVALAAAGATLATAARPCARLALTLALGVKVPLRPTTELVVVVVGVAVLHAHEAHAEGVAVEELEDLVDELLVSRPDGAPAAVAAAGAV